MASKTLTNRVISLAAVAVVASSLGGCADAVKNVGDYLNLRNSFLNPSEVGRFDKNNPWNMFGPSKPVTWPILEQLDIIDEPNSKFTLATDPMPSDLVVEQKEYIVGEGDLLQVSVFELLTPGLPYERQVQVNEVGKITLHNLDQVDVKGLTPTQIEQKIGQLAVEKQLLLPRTATTPGPQVSVQLLQSRARVFSVLGQTGRPGTYNIIGTDFRLLDAMALAGDVAGGSQPGMDYMYIIRQQKGAGVIPPRDGQPAGTPTTNPLDSIDLLNTPTQPATRPAGGEPSASANTDEPKFVRNLPPQILSLYASSQAVQELEAGLNLGAPAQSTPIQTSTPVQGNPPVQSGATGVAPTPGTPVAQVTQGRDDPLMNQAVGGGRPGMIFVDGKWVEVGSSGTQLSPAEAMAAATGMTMPRVIRIPIQKLKEGDPRFNIVIQPGDVINVPNIEPGEFYLMGHVGRPGVYSLTGRKVTLKQAISAAGGLDALAIPRRCDLIRRVGKVEVWVQVDLQRIFDGEQPDMFLKENDMVNVGSDMLAPILAITRNAYRATYGWGYIYDRNLYNAPVITQSQQ